MKLRLTGWRKTHHAEQQKKLLVQSINGREEFPQADSEKLSKLPVTVEIKSLQRKFFHSAVSDHSKPICLLIFSLFSASGDTAATEYGKTNEEVALRQLEEHLGVTIVEPKKIVDKEHKFLVCIPDGIIDEDTLVEIKCPYKCADDSIEALARNDPGFCLELAAGGKLQLKKDHDYFYQVQGELNIAQKEICYFVVWSPTEFHCEKILRDSKFWKLKMFPWLLDFYR